MALIVQKFGGSSVKDRDRIFNVARIVANTHNAGTPVAPLTRNWCATICVAGLRSTIISGSY